MMYLGKNPVALSHTLNTGSGDFVDTDTKNTAGATDTSDKIFIVGAKIPRMLVLMVVYILTGRKF